MNISYTVSWEQLSDLNFKKSSGHKFNPVSLRLHRNFGVENIKICLKLHEIHVLMCKLC